MGEDSGDIYDGTYTASNRNPKGSIPGLTQLILVIFMIQMVISIRKLYVWQCLWRVGYI